MSLSADDILHALTALSEELAHRDQRAQIVVVGETAMVLLFNTRHSTNDVDAYFVRPTAAEIQDAVQAVATRLELPSDWLHDRAQDHPVGVTLGAVIFESEHLKVRAPTTVQLLAAKLANWRGAIDRDDARLLLLEMEEGSAEQIWGWVRRYIPEGEIDEVSAAFDDLWESVKGRS